LQDYLAYLKSGATLHDEIDYIQVGTVVVVASYKKNTKVLWFGKVINIDKGYVDVTWLHRCKNTTKYYYTDSSLNCIHIDTIIYNEKEFTPKFGNKLVWKLLTLLPFLYILHESPE
jgi:predicted DNA binding protein